MNEKDTVQICVRVDRQLKENSDKILSKLGITPTAAISMLFSQVVLTKSFPLDLKIPEAELSNLVLDESEDKDTDDADSYE